MESTPLQDAPLRPCLRCKHPNAADAERCASCRELLIVDTPLVSARVPSGRTTRAQGALRTFWRAKRRAMDENRLRGRISLEEALGGLALLVAITTVASFSALPIQREQPRFVNNPRTLLYGAPLIALIWPCIHSVLFSKIVGVAGVLGALGVLVFGDLGPLDTLRCAMVALSGACCVAWAMSRDE
ncbi:hypothetical protein [Haliangium ochraceum]|uniref:Uncharacterized protein n=1 Tax=Haliangium ochraceum (strain DSM 14365 / JCM 11303 / SMP-2) TaxID=502025 RepID=D0LM03_HALO1|nr:hypothetical protein [Haliangium ochraceum]ACY15181.1 hypothetical protein Hoch_2649 [Haliangium ochraceum DSM 14365]